MAATITSEHRLYDGISYTDRYGTPVSLETSLLVTGITQSGYPLEFAREVCAALDANDPPYSYGSHPAYLSGETAVYYNTLVLIERAIEPVHGDPTKALVRLRYAHFYENDGQTISLPRSGGESALFWLRDISSAQQITVNNYPSDYGEDGSEDSDLRGKPIEVAYTYPDGTATYKDAAGNTLAKDEELAGKTEKQVASVKLFQPMRRIEITGIREEDSPAYTKRKCFLHTNYNTWLGGDQGTWLCVRADYEPYDIDSTPKKYKWVFEFEYNREGWNPSASFIDKRTGQPPSGLVGGTGSIDLEYYKMEPFDIVFSEKRIIGI